MRQEIGKDSSSSIESGGMRIVLRIPVIFDLGELFSRVLGAQSKMSLSVIDVAFCKGRKGTLAY